MPFFLLFSSFSSAVTIEQLYWEPENPQPGDEITVYAKISGNISQVKYQYCIGEACFPGTMQKNGDVWQFVIPSSDVKEGTGYLTVEIDGKELLRCLNHLTVVDVYELIGYSHYKVLIITCIGDIGNVV